MAAACTSLHLDRLLEALYGREVCRTAFAALQTLDARQLGALRDLVVTRLAAEDGPLNKDALKTDLLAALAPQSPGPAAATDLYDPVHLRTLLYQDLMTDTAPMARSGEDG